MDQAFMHPAERDIMAKLNKMEDRLVKLNLKGLHATGRIMYLVAAAWKMGNRKEPLKDKHTKPLWKRAKRCPMNGSKTTPREMTRKPHSDETLSKSPSVLRTRQARILLLCQTG
jgi:hypothetical protein